MESSNHKLLNIVIFIGLVVTISTAIILPNLNWEEETLVKSEKESFDTQAAIAKGP
jgi:hypothetical protein